MNDEKYPDFLNEISNYLLGIANYSKLYVDNIITTIMQFLTFMNTYKFEGKYDSLNKFSINVPVDFIRVGSELVINSLSCV